MISRDPWTDLHHLAERLGRVLDDVQPGGGTARASLAAVSDEQARETITAYLELVQRIGTLIREQITSERHERTT